MDVRVTPIDPLLTIHKSCNYKCLHSASLIFRCLLLSLTRKEDWLARGGGWNSGYLHLCCTWKIPNNKVLDWYRLIDRSDRSNLENWSTFQGGPLFSKLFRFDRTNSVLDWNFRSFWLNGSRALFLMLIADSRVWLPNKKSWAYLSLAVPNYPMHRSLWLKLATYWSKTY